MIGLPFPRPRRAARGVALATARRSLRHGGVGPATIGPTLRRSRADADRSTSSAAEPRTAARGRDRSAACATGRQALRSVRARCRRRLVVNQARRGGRDGGPARTARGPARRARRRLQRRARRSRSDTQRSRARSPSSAARAIATTPSTSRNAHSPEREHVLDAEVGDGQQRHRAGRGRTARRRDPVARARTRRRSSSVGDEREDEQHRHRDRGRRTAERAQQHGPRVEPRGARGASPRAAGRARCRSPPR